MLALHTDEQKWLDAYRAALAERYPRVIERVSVFGSNARGEAHGNSDLDVLVLVNVDDRHLHREVRNIGYSLATDLHIAGGAEYVVASIMVYSVAEWETRLNENSPFQKSVEKDAVDIWTNDRHQIALC